MRLGFVAVHSACAFLHLSALPTQHNNACIDASRGEIKSGAQHRLMFDRLSGSSLRNFVGGILSRKRCLPRSKLSYPVLDRDDLRPLLRILMHVLHRILLESSCFASAFALASIVLLGKFKIEFIISNVIRSMVVLLAVKMFAVQSRMAWTTSLEINDWFCPGSYHILLENDNNLSRETIPARIRQVPGDGSCLFQAIAAGVLLNETLPHNDVDHEHADRTLHSHKSNAEVILYSSTLRDLAVKTLLDGMENHSSMELQHGDTISATSLVSMAANQYGMTSDHYLSEIRQTNVWGGVPEIVALANNLDRPIVMLETVHS